jgi:hypothetical protein
VSFASSFPPSAPLPATTTTAALVEQIGAFVTTYRGDDAVTARETAATAATAVAAAAAAAAAAVASANLETTTTTTTMATTTVESVAPEDRVKVFDAEFETPAAAAATAAASSAEAKAAVARKTAIAAATAWSTAAAAVAPSTATFDPRWAAAAGVYASPGVGHSMCASCLTLRAPLAPCARCGGVAYCGAKCAKIHWVVHRTECCKKLIQL